MNRLIEAVRHSGLSLLIVTMAVQGCDGGAGASADAMCREAATGRYPAQETSPYVLPFPVGETHFVGQGNCTHGSHNDEIDQQFAYDFRMPIGNAIVAVSEGVVVAIEESHVDGTGTPGEENYVVIEHADGSASRYIHLTTLGALVELQDSVEQGQIIAMSGNTGNSTEPHLHFDVSDGPCATELYASCQSFPVSFRNTRAHENGLIQGQNYTAE